MGKLFDIPRFAELAPAQMRGDEEYPGLGESVARHPASHTSQEIDHEMVEHTEIEASLGQFFTREDPEQFLRTLGTTPMRDLIDLTEEK